MIRSAAMPYPLATVPIDVFLRVPAVVPATVSPTDVAVVVVYLLLTVAIGLWIGRGQKDLSDYLLGDRNLPWWAVLGSIVATETSTATVLSVPGWAFVEGGDLRGLQLTFGYIVGRIAVAFVLLPQYFRGDLFTSYEVLNRRFGGPTKTTASLLFLLTRTSADGLRLFLAAIVLSKFAGMPLWAAVWSVGIATIIYTVFGGMRSVVWNDCAQFVVYMVGGLVSLAVIFSRLPGGWDGFVEYGQTTGRFELFDFSLVFDDAFTFWAGLIGGAFLTLGTHGTDQLTVQRLLSSRNEKDARRALIASGFVVLAQFALFLFIGIGLAAYFAAFPPRMEIERPDGAFATFIVEALPVGLCGLMLAAVFAAAMSTLSSSLNSSAAAAVNDLIRPALRDPSPGMLLGLGRGLTVLFGLAQIGIGLIGPQLGGNVVDNVLAIASFTTGIILGVFFLGVLTSRVSQSAALVGFVGGAAVTTAVLLGYRPAWPWFALIGAASTFAIGLAASLLLPERRETASVSD